MSTQTNEAKIIISGQDQLGSAFSSVQARFQQVMGSADGLKSKLSNIGGGAFGNLTSSLGTLHGKLAAMGLLGSSGVAISGLMAVKTAFDSVVSTAEKGDRISDLGGRLRLNAEEFQAFEKFAKDSGASVEEVGSAFLKLKLNIGTAQSEGGDKLAKLEKDLYAFGITSKQAFEMKPIDLMKKMGLVSSKSTTDADEMLKIEKFRALAGKTGATLIPVFEAIGTGYDSLIAKMRASGTLMTDQMAELSGSAFKAYEKSKGAMGGLKMAFGIEMMPVFETFSKVMEDRMKANRTAMMPGVKALANVLSVNLKPFLDDMDGVADKTSGVFKWLGKLAGLVGWDKLIFGGLALIAAPFVMSIGVAVAAISTLAFNFARTAVIATAQFIPAMIATGVQLIRSVGMSYAMLGPLGLLQLGFTTAARSALAFTAALLTNPITWIAIAVAAAAYFIYSNWEGVSSFFVGVWEGVAHSFEPVSQMFKLLVQEIGAAISWFADLFHITGGGVNSFQDWSNAGRLAGEVIGGVFKALLSPIFAVIDALKLVSATWDFIHGKDFTFNSTLAKAWGHTSGEDVKTGSLGTSTPINTPSLGMPQIVSSRTEVGGKLDIRISSDGKPSVERLESNNRNFDIDARAGQMGMYGTGA